MLSKILNAIDIFPGYKLNSSSAVLLLTSLLSFLGVNPAYIQPIGIIAQAVMVFALTMKGLRGTPLMTATATPVAQETAPATASIPNPTQEAQ